MSPHASTYERSDDVSSSTMLEENRANANSAGIAVQCDRRDLSASGSGTVDPVARQSVAEMSPDRRRGHSKEVSDILKGWLDEHREHPYPQEQAKTDLMSRTGLGRTQINNWFINARRRYLPKPNGNAQEVNGKAKLVARSARSHQLSVQRRRKRKLEAAMETHLSQSGRSSPEEANSSSGSSSGSDSSSSDDDASSGAPSPMDVSAQIYSILPPYEDGSHDKWSILVQVAADRWSALQRNTEQVMEM